MAISKTKTNNVAGIADVTREMGDKLLDRFNETNNLRTGGLALSAYRTSISAIRAGIYKDRVTVPAKKKSEKK